MDFIDFTAGTDDEGRRLDKIIRILAENLPLSQIYKLLRKGLIRLNGKKSSAEVRVHSGDVIQIASFLLADGSDDTDTPAAQDGPTEQSPLTLSKESIVFENENLLVINKPYDVNVHGDKDALDFQVRAYLQKTYDATFPHSLSFSPGPLHRLDRKTSGLLVFSKSLAGARWFSENINSHAVEKAYCAILQGHLEASASWKDFIYSKEEEGNNFHTVKCSDKALSSEWKNAESYVRPLAYGQLGNQPLTLAEIVIKTGRKHQIRAQSSFHGFPLLGDTAYGAKEIKEKALKRDFYLMAARLTVPENPVGLPNELKLDYKKDFFDIIKYCDIK